MNLFTIIRKSIFIVLIILIIVLSKGSNNEVQKSDQYYGYLTIPSINMNLGFYDYNNSLNTVSKNIELINTGIKDTYLIAGHSGTGKLAYFNDLRKLSVGDYIYLKINNNDYKYIIKDIISTKKNGKISIPRESNWLILTTCDQINKGYQLTIWSYIC